MTKDYPENAVVLRMDPPSWHEGEYFEVASDHDTIEEAKRQALHFSCMAATRTIHVYGKGGVLEYFYDKQTNFFSPVSEAAKEREEKIRQEIWKEMMSGQMKNTEQVKPEGKPF